MIIDLIRHTTPKIESGICYGQSDLDLADSFEQEAQCVNKKALPNYDTIVTSPLQRCKKLALRLSGTELIEDARIMEYDFGDWESKPWSELTSPHAQAWMNDFVDLAPPNGESLICMQRRVLHFWAELLDKKHQHIAVVTHSGVLRIIHAHILETPLKAIFRLEIDYGDIVRVTHHSRTSLTTVKHL